ncbi:conjugal transfer protein [Burkholderia cenocepacia]|uniref:conjugal transfer protein n=1 Tax=Burkholderia cenocepacia TaxID=95486 RepID=UPI003849BA75
MNKVVAAFLAVLCSGSCYAGGMPVFTGGLVFDPTNFSQNVIKAAQTAQKVILQGQQYALQMQQYEMQVKQLAAINPQQLAALGGATVADLLGVNNYVSSLQNVVGDLKSVSTALNNRFTEAQLSGQTWSQYLASQQAAIKARVQSAQIRAQNEAAMLQAVQNDYAMAAQWQARIPATMGTNEDVQLLNAQMNRVLMQNSQIIKMLVDKNGALKANSEADELGRRNQDAAARTIFNGAIQQDNQNSRSLINGLQ